MNKESKIGKKKDGPIRYFRVGKWNGKKSIRVRIGYLWLGGSWDKERHPAAWIIFNGKRRGWQFLSWQRPRWTSWPVKATLAAEPEAATAGQDSRESAGLEG